MGSLIGKSLGRYEILEELGEGGMAVVYRANDSRLDRDVAIKVIRKGAFPADHIDRILKRFEREAKALARLSHPNIMKVHDYGEHEGSPYLVMEYLPGGTLKKKMGKPMPWEQAIQLILPIAEALDYAHSQNMIHRDVKPSNILLTGRGQPMLTDFGIAKILEVEEGQTLTGTGMGVGTPEYMSPEQWKGKSSPRSDIYSLGVVLYELLAGRKPYLADTPADLLLKQATEPLPRLSKFAKGLPANLEKAVFMALERKPEDRYTSMAEFASSLEGLLKESPALAAIPTNKGKDTQATVEEVKPPPSKKTGSATTRTATDPNAFINRNKKPARKLPLITGFSITFGLLGIATVLFLIFSSNTSKPQSQAQASTTPTKEKIPSALPTITKNLINTEVPQSLTLTPTESLSSLLIGKWSFFEQPYCRSSAWTNVTYIVKLKDDGTFTRGAPVKLNGETAVDFDVHEGTWIFDKDIVILTIGGHIYKGRLDGDKLVEGIVDQLQVATVSWSDSYTYINGTCWNAVRTGE